MKYELRKVKDYSSETVMLVGTSESGIEWFIPQDESNSDYQQYLIETDGGLPEPPAEADAPAKSTTTK